jgi:HD-like signal output (HDOD) protein
MGHIANLELTNLDFPAPPTSLVKLSTLLSNDEVNMAEMAQLIETDMALAAAVMKTVSSPLYGLRGRAQSLKQAVTFLGTREIAATVYQLSLQAAFPAVAELRPVWERAAVRGILMGRLAQELYLDAWCAHTAGMFQECGKAVLFKLAPDAYRTLLAKATSDIELVQLETQAFGTRFDHLGAKLCESWHLDPGAVACVRHHVDTMATHRLPKDSPRRAMSVLAAMVHTLWTEPQKLEELCQTLAPQAMMDQSQLLKGARRVKQKVDDALSEGAD